MSIKNADTRTKYENRGDYDSHIYHRDKNYIETNRKTSKTRKEKNQALKMLIQEKLYVILMI